MKSQSKLLYNSSILITGGTGSFGKEFINICLKNYKPKKIIIFSRDELKQYEMQNDPNIRQYIKQKKLRFFIGDIRDKERLEMATQNVDIVIHAAALKQVPTAEYNPFETVKTNIIGSQNVIEACLKNNVKRVIALSTDKASSPVNLYGATKLTSDKLFIAANNYKGNKNIKFSIVRYGNVLKSRGSVVPYFLQFKNLGWFPVTSKKMTRFNITLNQGVDFVISSLDLMWGGEVFIPKISSYSIVDVAKAINSKNKIKEIGIRGGEKLHEEMISVSESFNSYEFKNYYTILPSKEYIQWNIKKYLNKNKKDIGHKCKEGFNYNSLDNKLFLNSNELKKLIFEN
tara:strand:+ start:803 stop:1831 length:1029 start_codon:yes stop_codon:yes gene_type:complete